MIRRSSLAACAAACAIALSSYAGFAQQAKPLEAQKLFPAGKTLAFVSLADAQTAAGAFESTDLGQVWKQLEAFRSALDVGSQTSLRKMRQEFRYNMGAELD